MPYQPGSDRAPRGPRPRGAFRFGRSGALAACALPLAAACAPGNRRRSPAMSSAFLYHSSAGTRSTFWSSRPRRCDLAIRHEPRRRLAGRAVVGEVVARNDAGRHPDRAQVRLGRADQRQLRARHERRAPGLHDRDELLRIDRHQPLAVGRPLADQRRRSAPRRTPPPSRPRPPAGRTGRSSARRAA